MTSQLRVNDHNIRNRVWLRSEDYNHKNSVLEQALAPLISTKRSAAFVSPHWGDYTSSFIEIAKIFPSSSKFVVIKGPRWSDEEGRLWNDLEAAYSWKMYIYEVSQEKKSLLSLTKHLKSGAHLFILFDLHDEFGQTEKIALFGLNFSMTNGWSHLCYLSKTVVIQVAPVSRERKDIQILDVIDPLSFSNRQDFEKHCLSSSGRSLKALLTENPAYWFMWGHLEKYLV